MSRDLIAKSRDIQIRSVAPGSDGKPTERDSLPQAALGGAIRKYLGQKLTASYEELLRQPVPDKFVELLERLGRKETDA
jgi:hypothetical protein